MLFDSPSADSYRENRLHQWFVAGGVLGILVFFSGLVVPARWGSYYDLLCPTANTFAGSDLGFQGLSLTSLLISVAFTLLSQFAIYGITAMAIGYILGLIRNRPRRGLE